jgi:hypothetical protein
MALIQHAGLKPWAAHTCPDRAWLDHSLDALPDEHPDKRWVLAKCVWGMRMDAQACESENWPFADQELAARFRVPVEKIADRRAELGADRAAQRPGRLCAELQPRGPARHVASAPDAHRRRRRRRVPRR